jgi:hypothetical protein
MVSTPLGKTKIADAAGMGMFAAGHNQQLATNS